MAERTASEGGQPAGRRWAGLGSNKQFLLLEHDDKRKEAGVLERKMGVEQVVWVLVGRVKIGKQSKDSAFWQVGRSRATDR